MALGRRYEYDEIIDEVKALERRFFSLKLSGASQHRSRFPSSRSSDFRRMTTSESARGHTHPFVP
jgi:hypothetical protein